MISALLIGREYNRYVEKRIGELIGFVGLLNHAKSEISMYLKPASKILRGFENESLERIGFISVARESGNLEEAFSKCSERLSLGKETKKILYECFSGFGQGYSAQEILRIERYAASLEKILEREREELPKNARMVSTLLLAGALGIFILLL